jgi:hypothetical protein
MRRTDPLLQQAIARSSSLPSDATVKIVAEPADEQHLQELAQFLSQNAEEPSVIRRHKVNANVKVSKLDEISRNSLIGSMRLARTHTAM